MNWDAIGAIADAVGAIAVVVTLIYLALQIRHNTRASKASAVSASNVSLRENRRAVLASAELTKLFVSGNTDPPSLSEIERHRYALMMLNVADAMLDNYTQTLETDFSPETWRTQGVSAVFRTLGTKGGRWFWENYSGSYPAAFRYEIDRVLSAGQAKEDQADGRAA